MDPRLYGSQAYVEELVVCISNIHTVFLIQVVSATARIKTTTNNNNNSRTAETEPNVICTIRYAPDH